MRHRISGASQTGLGGNNAPEMIKETRPTDPLLTKKINRCAKDCYKLFNFEKYGYCDAGMDGEEIRIGVEPAYIYDELKIIIINKDKDDSRYVTGKAWDVWGSGLVTTVREYRDYKHRSKFIRFIDKWHPILFNEKI